MPVRHETNGGACATAIAFSPNGQSVITGHHNGEVRAWGIGLDFKARIGKCFDQLVFRVDFLIFRRRPAEQCKIVHERPWYKSVLFIEMNGHQLPVRPFGNLPLLGIQGKRHMGKCGNGGAQCLVNQYLLGGVGQPVLPPNNMGYSVSNSS